MATSDQVLELRRLIDEPTQDTYPDPDLEARIDAAGSVRAAAAAIWQEKAARYAGLVDVSEGNSRRTLSQLYRQAIEMAGALSVDTAPRARVSRTRAIERP